MGKYCQYSRNRVPPNSLIYNNIVYGCDVLVTDGCPRAACAPVQETASEMTTTTTTGSHGEEKQIN